MSYDTTGNAVELGQGIPLYTAFGDFGPQLGVAPGAAGTGIGIEVGPQVSPTVNLTPGQQAATPGNAVSDWLDTAAPLTLILIGLILLIFIEPLSRK